MNACVESSDACLLLELYVALFDLDFFNLMSNTYAYGRTDVQWSETRLNRCQSKCVIKSF